MSSRRGSELFLMFAVADQISIGDSDEALGRMLGTLRFWFTKDLVCPYPLPLFQTLG